MFLFVLLKTDLHFVTLRLVYTIRANVLVGTDSSYCHYVNTLYKLLSRMGVPVTPMRVTSEILGPCLFEQLVYVLSQVMFVI